MITHMARDPLHKFPLQSRRPGDLNDFGRGRQSTANTKHIMMMRRGGCKFPLRNRWRVDLNDFVRREHVTVNTKHILVPRPAVAKVSASKPSVRRLE